MAFQSGDRDRAALYGGDQRLGVVIRSGLGGLNQQRVVRNFVGRDQIAGGIVQRVGAVGVHRVRDRAGIAVGMIAVRQRVRRGIEVDGEKIAVVGARGAHGCVRDGVRG